ncbi:MAG: pre-peptidase C-terminal domain-containing protein [Planctomycetaceae bacterium]|nr:pre-peptidase C-terminal domain-containing protein [Planctomycetaceae bacterium]
MPRRFRLPRWIAIVGALSAICTAAFSTVAFAQLPQTRLYALFPPGGKAGTTVELTLTRGDDLDDVNKLLFSHPGLAASPKMQDVAGKQEPVPNVFTVTISGDVPVGRHEVRAVGLFGISNPRSFIVGDRIEIAETEPNNAVEQATPVALDQTVNGRINGGPDVDWYKFPATAGQRIVIECQGRRIDSRLDGLLEVYDQQGRRLATARNTVGHDPVVDFTAPAAGDYLLRATDFVYASSEDYFYRLTLRTGPYIDYILPPAGVPGSTAQYTLFGRNLPQGEPAGVTLHGQPLQKQVVSIALPSDPATLDSTMLIEPFAAGVDGVPYTLESPTGRSNAVMIGFAPAAVALEVEPNNRAAEAQKIAVPAELAGQFQSRGDVDAYQFEAKAGTVYWIEVQGQRLGAGSDPYLAIDQVTVNDKMEETLKRIAAVDDDATNLLPIVFDTLHDDPVYKFAVPADGTYRLMLRDRYGASRGDAGLLYRVSIRPETPEFRLVVVTDALSPPNQKIPSTWSVGLRRGDQFPVQVLVLRKDGFIGLVDVSVEGLPEGVTCRDITVGATPSNGILVFTSAENAPVWSGTVKVVGKAKIDDPAKAAAVAAAQAAVKPADDAVSAADKAIAKPAEDLQKAKDALAAAQTELAAKTDDEALKKKVADADAAVKTAEAAHQTAVAAKTAAEQKRTEAQAAAQQAEAARVASVKDVAHEARYGTIVWGGKPNIPGDARLSRNLELSVVEEAAPYQLTTDLHRVVVNHNRQVLIPVKLIRRNGFDANVALTFVGQPPNVQIENKPINKGKDDEVYRFFVPANAPVGTFVMHLAGQAQVSYRRNPQKADKLKVEYDAVEKTANEATEAQKAAVAKRDEANKLVTTNQEAVKKATEAKAAADKALTDAQAAEKAAAEAVTKAGDNVDAKAEAEKKLTEAQAVVKTATETVQTAEKTRVDAEAAVKTAEQAKATGEAEVKQADDRIKATTAEKAAADKRFKDADTAAKAKNLNFLPPTTPIVLTIKPAPYTIAATPGNSGNLKIGEKLELKVDVKRQNGFTGPVTLTLPLPPGVTGVKAEPVAVPADQAAGTLVVEAVEGATEGQLPNLVVRVASEFDGEAAVDQPVVIKVMK